MSEQLPPGTATLPELLKKRGLHTAVIGSSFTRPSMPIGNSWRSIRIDTVVPPPPDGRAGADAQFPPVNVSKDPAPKDKTSREFPPLEETSLRSLRRFGPRPRRTATTAWRAAVALLGGFRDDEEHFFLSVQQSRPHTPLIAPKKYLDLYDPAKIPEPAAPPSC